MQTRKPAELIENAAAAAIVRAAAKNPHITAAALRDELDRGEVGEWLTLPAVRACNFAQWSAAMSLAADRVSV